MIDERSSIEQSLDVAFHSNFYQKATQYGPLQIPNGLSDRLLETGISVAKKTTGFFLDHVTPWFGEKIAQHSLECKALVQQKHIPTARNWTRAMNGTMQSLGLGAISLLYGESLIGNVLLCGSIGWGAISIRHLYVANYSESYGKDMWDNARLIGTG